MIPRVIIGIFTCVPAIIRAANGDFTAAIYFILLGIFLLMLLREFE